MDETRKSCHKKFHSIVPQIRQNSIHFDNHLKHTDIPVPQNNTLQDENIHGIEFTELNISDL